MLEKGFREQDTVMGKFKGVTADYQMLVTDYVVRVYANDASGPITITLPPVEQAAGRIYTIVAREADVNAAILVQDKDDSECWEGDQVMNGDCDALICYSDGLMWFVWGNLTKHLGSPSASATTSASQSPSASVSPSPSSSVSASPSVSVSPSASPS
jgi:hypothetical protein